MTLNTDSLAAVLARRDWENPASLSLIVLKRTRRFAAGVLRRTPVTTSVRHSYSH